VPSIPRLPDTGARTHRDRDRDRDSYRHSDDGRHTGPTSSRSKKNRNYHRDKERVRRVVTDNEDRLRRTGRRSSTGGRRVKTTSQSQTKGYSSKKRDSTSGVKGGDRDRKVYGSKDRDGDRDRVVYGSKDGDGDGDRDREWYGSGDSNREESRVSDLERWQSSDGDEDGDGDGVGLSEDWDIVSGNDVHLSFSSRQYQYRNFLIETWRPSACFIDTLTGVDKDNGKQVGAGLKAGMKTGAGARAGVWRDKDRGSDFVENRRSSLGPHVGTGDRPWGKEKGSGAVEGTGGSRIEQGIPEVVAAQAIAAAEAGAE
jgi:hypothetical protein